MTTLFPSSVVPPPLGPPAGHPAAGDVIVPTDLEKRTVIDKTADFVARNGPAFEHKILINETQNPVFSFLKASDPYNAYYKKRIREIKSLLPGAQPEVHYPTSFPTEEKRKPTETKEQPKPVQLSPPEREQWIIDLPDISPVDLEVIKLTAQFVARNGKAFHMGLINREKNNPNFDFLKQTHHLNRVFLALVDAYVRVLLPEKDLSEKMAAKYGDKQRLMKRLNDRAEWERMQRRMREQENEEEKEREARAQIDWHDFVVVETITFDDELKLPPLAPAPVKKEVPVEQEADADGDMDMDMDMDMDVDLDVAGEGGEMKIRKDWPPKPQSEGGVAKALKYAKCPMCGEEIPIEEMEKHMEIELRDPQARKKKLEQMKRKRESVLAEGTEVGRNLQDLSERRSDIFGEDAEVEMGKKVGKDDEYKPKKIIWDGHTGSIAMTANAVMATQTPDTRDQTPKIGAAMPSTAPPIIIPVPTPTSAPPGAGLLATPLIPRPAVTVNSAPPVSAPIPMRPPMGAPMMSPYPGMPPMMPGMPYPGMPYPGMPMMPGMPGPPGAMMMPMGEPDQPDLKRQKLGHKELIPEEEFLKRHQGNVAIKVAVPQGVTDDPAVRPEWNLNGQTLTFEVPLSSTIMNVKHLIKAQLGGMPPTKQKLDVKGVGFLKDNATLASYNINENVTINLGVKARGRGGKK